MDIQIPGTNQNNIDYRKKFHEYRRGLTQGIPIALGYLPVSFTFGLMAVNGGMPAWIAIFISMSNLTSAGQFAGTGLILTGAPLIEITLTTFVINIRYMLMSLSLSQKVVPKTSVLQRLLMAFGITDETFSVASMEKGAISFSYMVGLETCPYWGWAIGTALGALTCSLLPQTLNNSMGIALYAMFIALVVPASKKSKAALSVVLISIMLSSVLKWAPYLNKISEGWSIIISTILACSAGAVLFPREGE